ncbi:MAG: nucleotidyl transferase AbiEii/AbiGii toxin family protein [Burkholderiales bacterium]
MFERPHHRDVALVLQSLDAPALSQRHCYFGGGTAMALRYGEYRESMDIDFVVSDLAGYRDLRQMLGNVRGFLPIAREGIEVELAREVRADQYGIRTQVRSGESTIKFEIVLEARIDLAAPDDSDRVCGIQTLAPIDLAAEKLLANADRWADDSVYSRDLIDLAMMRADRRLLEAACVKAEGAYGESVRRSLSQAVDALETRRERLEACMTALSIGGVTRAQLWQAIRTVARQLLA